MGWPGAVATRSVLAGRVPEISPTRPQSRVVSCLQVITSHDFTDSTEVST
jgi:hypothetical protein